MPKLKARSGVTLRDRMTAAQYQKLISESAIVEDDGKDRCHPEQDQQIKLFEIVRENLHEYPRAAFLIHIPNGDLRNKAVAARLKMAGVKSGVSDLFLPVPVERVYSTNPYDSLNRNRRVFYGHPGLWIELKIKPNKPSQEQHAWLGDMTRLGYKVAVCYSADEAWQTIKDYLDLDRP